MEEDDSANAANSEIRFIALELMKIANKKGVGFESVAKEYIENTERLQNMIYGEDLPKKAGKAEKSRQK